jgi:hypothetical protein
MSGNRDENWVEEDSPNRLPRYADEPPRSAREDREDFFEFEPRRHRPDRFSWGPLLAAAAVGCVVVAMFGPCRRTDSQREAEVASLQSELESTKDRAVQLESQLSAERADGPKADAPEPRAPEPEQETAPAPKSPAPKPEERSELSPEEVLRRKAPTAEPAAAKETEPAAATTETPISSPSPEPPPAQPDQVALAEPQGSVSVYEVPDASAPIVRSTSRSGKAGVATLQVLAPERAGWTTEAQPTLYWHASQGIGFPGEFTLTREGEDEPVLHAQLAAPDEAGIQRIELSQADVSLEEGVSYRWTISFAGPDNSGTNMATGGIRRVTRPQTLHATGASSVSERLDALERAGLWYDALDLVTRSIADNSGAKNLVVRRNAMLGRVGIHLPSS